MRKPPALFCDTYDGNLTYTGSYLILETETGIYTDASGSGALSFGLATPSIESGSHTIHRQPVDGQLQMTGNISLSTGANRAAESGTRSDC